MKKIINWQSNKKRKDAEKRDVKLTNKVPDKTLKSQRKHMLPIYSYNLNSYQFDILVKSKNGDSDFLIFINVNSRKAYAYPIKNKNAKTVLKVLNKFYSDVNENISSLTSDQEASFLSEPVVDWMLDKSIEFKTTTENNHNILGIINRFIKTLRDMNEDRDFSKKDMEDIITEYNASIHSSIKKAPNDFQEEDNEKYVDEKELETEKIKNLKPIIKDGDKVRVLDEEIPTFKKKRSQFSKKALIVDGRDGNGFVVRASDDSVGRYSRYKLIKATNGVKIEESINNGKFGLIEHINDFKNGRYNVTYKGGVEDKITPRNLRESYPINLTWDELEYWSRPENKGYIIKPTRDMKEKIFKYFPNRLQTPISNSN